MQRSSATQQVHAQRGHPGRPRLSAPSAQQDHVDNWTRDREHLAALQTTPAVYHARSNRCVLLALRTNPPSLRCAPCRAAVSCSGDTSRTHTAAFPRFLSRFLLRMRGSCGRNRGRCTAAFSEFLSWLLLCVRGSCGGGGRRLRRWLATLCAGRGVYSRCVLLAGVVGMPTRCCGGFFPPEGCVVWGGATCREGVRGGSAACSSVASGGVLGTRCAPLIADVLHFAQRFSKREGFWQKNEHRYEQKYGQTPKDAIYKIPVDRGCSAHCAEVRAGRAQMFCTNTPQRQNGRLVQGLVQGKHIAMIDRMSFMGR